MAHGVQLAVAAEGGLPSGSIASRKGISKRGRSAASRSINSRRTTWPDSMGGVEGNPVSCESGAGDVVNSLMTWCERQGYRSPGEGIPAVGSRST